MNRKLAETLDRLLLQIEAGQRYVKDSRYICEPCEDSGWVEIEGTEHGARQVRRCENPIHVKPKEHPRTEAFR